MEVDRILQMIKPNGVSWIGKAGSSSRVRELPGGEKEAERFLNLLTKDKLYPSRPMKNNLGDIYEIPANGGQISYRQTSKSGPVTIEVNLGGAKNSIKLKFLNE